MLWTWIIIGVVIIALIVVAECIARFQLGFGDPPLWRPDQDYEYIPVASSTYRRFGNTIRYNSHSMRANEVPPRKTDPNELRIIVAGDSIVNGGVRSDQSELATTLLEQRLNQSLNRPVWVGNVAAGSWGPPNVLGYFRRHGLFDADIVVLVFNSPDYFKEMRIRPLTPMHPSRKPILALQELLIRYPYRAIRNRVRARKIRQRQQARTGEHSERALHELLPLIGDSGARCILLQHLKRSELDDGPEAGFERIGAIARAHGVDPINLGPVFQRAVDAGENPYRDGFHPNALGHRLIEQVIEAEVLQALDEPDGRSS